MRTDCNSLTFYCQVETGDHRKDYLRGGRCARLVGVEEQAWHQFELAPSTSYVIDIDYWELGQAMFGSHRRWWLNFWPYYDSQWLKVSVQTGGGRSYFFPAFSNAVELPVACRLTAVSPVEGPALPRFPEQALNYDANVFGNRRVTLTAFHVGQGMASLIGDGVTGILIDAGAGAPVTRKRYPRIVRNDLARELEHLQKVDFVLSHADSDHWRILHWDPLIRGRIERIFAPTGVSSVLFNDPAVRSKIRWVSSCSTALGSGARLEILRTKPVVSDANGQALVVVFERGESIALLPGDYVYGRMRSDGERRLNDLAKRLFSAVVVPHHGDEASSGGVFRAAHDGKAFFSAGTHRSYRHPRATSLAAHDLAGYTNVVDNKQPDIVAVTLL